MFEFTNTGCGKCVLLEKNNTGVFIAALLDREEFVVANSLTKNSDNDCYYWYYGSYFKDLNSAFQLYNDIE